MFPPRFSLKFLLLFIATMAALLAVPAWFIAQVRNEAAAAKRIIALGHEDIHQAGGVILTDAVSYSMPRGQVRRWFHTIAGSPGEADGVRIMGDESARGITALARSLPHVSGVTVAPSAAILGEYSLITQSQIDAVACFESIWSLNFCGPFDRGLDFRSWSRVKRIVMVEITSDFIPPAIAERLADANVEFLTIYFRYYWMRDIPPDAEGFPFEKITAPKVRIVGRLDDRALERISRAPRLQYLEFRCGGSRKAPPRLTDAGIRRACQNLHVRHLTIYDSSQITEPTAEALASIRELRTFNLNLTPAARDRLFALRPDLK